MAAICHAPSLLINANVLKGKTLTCYPSISVDVKNAGGRYVDQPVVEDGNLITSRKPDDLPQFNQALLRPAGRAVNRLAAEHSPYLLQHAANPVDWYPWGDEAFAKPRAEDKPIFLSIGYSTCHWCHVMEHESFESEEIARRSSTSTSSRSRSIARSGPTSIAST